MTTEAGFQTRFKTVKAVEGWRNAIQAKQCSTWPSYVWWVKVFYELSVELASQVSHSVLCLSALDMFHPERKFKKRPETATIKGKNEETMNTTDAECWVTVLPKDGRWAAAFIAPFSTQSLLSQLLWISI